MEPALDAAQLNATAEIPGSFSYVPSTGSVLNAGLHSLTATFVPDDTSTYANSTANVLLIVDKATPTITWDNSSYNHLRGQHLMQHN